MRRFVKAVLCALALSAGCYNVDYEGGRFVPANNAWYMNGEPMDMRHGR